LPWREDVVLLAVLAGLVVTGYRMAALHPYQYVYFNALVGGHRGAQGRYETDYWCVSEREAYRWLVSQKRIPPDGTTRVCTSGSSYQFERYRTPGAWYMPDGHRAHYSLVVNMEYAGLDPDARRAYESSAIHRVEREGASLCLVRENPMMARRDP